MRVLLFSFASGSLSSSSLSASSLSSSSLTRSSLGVATSICAREIVVVERQNKNLGFDASIMIMMDDSDVT